MAYNKFDNYYRDENGNVHWDIPLGTSPQDAYARTNKRLKEEVKRIEEQIDKTNNNIQNQLERLEESISDVSDTAKSQLDSTVESLSGYIGELSERLDSNITTVNSSINAEVVKINSRVDNIIATSTATEGNSELIDIRTAIDGTVYETAGKAIRSKIKKIQHDLDDAFTISNNIIDEDNCENGSISASGEYINTADRLRTDFITPVSVPFYITRNNRGIIRIAHYDKDKNFIRKH